MLAGEFSISGKFAHVVIHVVIFRRVGVPVLDQGLDHRHDLADVSGRARFLVRRQHAQRHRIFVHLIDKALRQRADRHVIFICALDDLVVDVGDVAHVGHLLIAVNLTQVARDHVEHHHHARVADVAEVVYRHAAHIHADIVRINRCEGFFFAREIIVNVQH